jgi:hypothetical protein
MKTRVGRGLLICISAFTGACGSMPEALLDSARESAKEAVQENVDELVDEFSDDLFDAELFELDPTEDDEE